ncbi:Secretory lipase (plasmid) [Tsukamurella tyrosinosolvens]|nr:Secretory lipase [Tsukamurella tyrosinosolvens]
MVNETSAFRIGSRVLAALISAVVVIATGIVTAPSAQALPPIVEPAPPADAFYDRPADLASLKPGEIVRTRTTSIRSLQVMPLNVDAWQLAYRTTGMNGEPDLSVTTVMVPRGKKPTKLLSYQAAADSTLRICQSSYATTKGGPIDLAAKEGPLTFGMPGAELLFAGLGVQEGWAVAMPDHGGGEDRFLTPRQPGWAVLDGIRAVENFSRLGMNAKTPSRSGATPAARSPAAGPSRSTRPTRRSSTSAAPPSARPSGTSPRRSRQSTPRCSRASSPWRSPRSARTPRSSASPSTRCSPPRAGRA